MIVLGLIVVLILAVVLSNGGNQSGADQPISRPEVGKEARIFTGDKSSAIAGVSREDFNEIAESFRVNDKMGVAKIMLQGRGFLIEPNTRILVIDRRGELARIRVLDGPTAGRDGWILSKWVQH